MVPLQWENESISEMNVAALHSFYKGDGRNATIKLLHAIRLLLSSTAKLSAVEHNSVEKSPSTDVGHHDASMLQCMTIATSSEDHISTFQGRRDCRKSNSRAKTIACHKQKCDIWSSDDLYVYCKPFMIISLNSDRIPSAEKASNVPCHKRYVPEICAALLFNLALIHHVAGMRKNNSCGNSSLLQKALLCYDEALHHVRNCTTSVAVLVLAICNNRIHLYHHYFYDGVQGRQQLSLMDDALTYIEHTYIPRKVECGREGGNPASNPEFCIVLTDPKKAMQTISGHDLHRCRLTYAFIKMHDFRLSPAA